MALHNNIIIPRDGIHFANLTELYLSCIDVDVFKNILNTAPKLESITLQKNNCDIWSIIPLIFQTQKFFKSLTIIENKYTDWDKIIESIDDSIYQITHYKCKTFNKYPQIRIALLFWGSPRKCGDILLFSSKPTLSKIFYKLSSIINQIVLFRFTIDFVFKIEFCGKLDGDLDFECDLFETKYKDIKLTTIRSTANKQFCQNMQLIITNKSNQMNGWSDGHSDIMQL